VPCASGYARYGLSKLAVWWLRLGIHIERIPPGHPEQNGRHERMHLTLKKAATNELLPMCPEWTFRRWLLSLDSNQDPPVNRRNKRR
jgi:integrase-like protein